MHDELHALGQVLDVDEPIVIRMRHEPAPANGRLLVRLGAGWIVTPDAPPCARRCGRKECSVTVVAEAFKTCAGCQWYSACTKDRLCWSTEKERLAEEGRRAANDRREQRRSTIRPAEMNGDARSGLDLLERMDQGLPLAELEESPETTGAGSGDSSNSGEPGLAQPAPTPEGERHSRSSAGGEASTKRKLKPRGYWTFDRIVEGFKHHAELTGEAPKTTLLNGSQGPVPEHLPAWTQLRKLTTYDEVLKAAELERPARKKYKLSGRGPSARPTTSPSPAPAAAAPTGKQPSRPDEAPPERVEHHDSHAFARAAIAAARAFADTLEQEFAE